MDFIDKELLKLTFKNTIPVLTGYLVLGFGFGVLIVSKGFPVWLAPLMSITMYAGALQYLAVDLLAQHIGYFSIAITTLLVNARHLFYGISLIEKYSKTGLGKIFLAFGLTDETYSLIASETNKEHSEKYYFYVTALNHLYWIIGGILGAVCGKMMPFNSTGIDFALTALFITIFVEQWINTDKHFSATTGLVSAFVCLLIFGTKNFLIPTMVIIGIALSFVRRYEERGNQ